MKTNICLNGLNECVAPTELYDNNTISLLQRFSPDGAKQNYIII